jgi:hypothetical protein
MPGRLPALAALLLLAGSLPSAPLPFPRDRNNGDLKAMQGVWEAVTLVGWFPGEAGGPPFPFVYPHPGVTVSVSGDTVGWHHGSRPKPALKLRLGRAGRFDTTLLPGVKGGGAFGPRQAEGIYEVEGDMLTLCDAPPGRRPAGFSADEFGQRVIILKRVRPRP